MNGLSLADSMASILSLFIHRRIPISIKKDYTICTG